LGGSGFGLNTFITELDMDGNILWAEQILASNNIISNGITLDAVGNRYITGYFTGSVLFGTISLISSSGLDIFIAKLDASGVPQWIKKTGGGTLDNNGTSIVSNPATGELYLTGYFTGTATFGSTTLTTAGTGFDVFVTKLDATGSFLWAKQAGGVRKM
jgi:hypothetical protein